MNAQLLQTASNLVPNFGILVNMVSRRVRQLTNGHRPLVEFAPGLQAADIALTEIIRGKLSFESTPGLNGKPEPVKVVVFPGSALEAKRAA
ncbi:MAG TPA: DNA-directed RNA polymerase subunit omega [Chthoniobacterales bacterium]|nr:DNA-directed RNA polymerase subunit omega [Chthoniobacterales bacterium]